MDTNVEDINRPAGQPSGASEAIEENEDDHETGASLQKRISKPSLKVIENKLVETENKLEDQWKRILKQVTKLQSPDQSAEEIRQGKSSPSVLNPNMPPPASLSNAVMVLTSNLWPVES